MTIDELVECTQKAREVVLQGVAVTPEQYEDLKAEAWKTTSYDGAVSAVAARMVFGVEVRVIPEGEAAPFDFYDCRS
jgi:hypothetical protein